MIRIKRVTRVPDYLRSYKILLDGRLVAELRGGQEAEIDVSPGIHELQASIDWCRTDPLRFESTGDTLEFECGSGLRGWRMLIFPLSILYTFVLRNRYLTLKKL